MVNTYTFYISFQNFSFSNLADEFIHDQVPNIMEEEQTEDLRHQYKEYFQDVVRYSLYKNKKDSGEVGEKGTPASVKTTPEDSDGDWTG